MQWGEQLAQFFDSFFGTTTFGYLWFALLALWGGTASYISRIRKSQMPFSLMELIGEWTIAGFAGMVTMYMCIEMKISPPATAALVGISGHMGGRAIGMLEHYFTRMKP